MINLGLSKHTRSLQALSIRSHLQHYSGKAASLNTAIHRGLRRSKGVGFRGSGRVSEKNYRSHEKQLEGNGSSRRAFEPSDYGRRVMERRSRTPGGLASSTEVRIRRGTKLVKTDAQLARKKPNPAGSPPAGAHGYGASPMTLFDNEASSEYQREFKNQRRQTESVGTHPDRSSSPQHNYESSRRRYESKIDRTETSEPSAMSRSRGGSHRTSDETSKSKAQFSKTNTGMPLSIPYTTPASEFLYGTSVVEAALRSRRSPRRQHYKLYIYTGENREKVDRDTDLERLARKNRVDIVKTKGDGLRLMDKMSAGRPHNGYILEASPLPRLPVTSLGQPTSGDTQSGFEIVVDYQSREEAAVNGTSGFVRTTRDKYRRKPLVLFLDSVVDPGNLGGILRTASFLGVSAVAISARNSAQLTPVVLKASAGASENMTLFSVNTPARFIQDSKQAGWRIFAAVAPKTDRELPKSMSTDKLLDPLSKDPCILMLGGEGDGLRQNLRSKADVEIFIPDYGTHAVESLNVNVATGILCHAFLAIPKTQKTSSEDGYIPQQITSDLF